MKQHYVFQKNCFVTFLLFCFFSIFCLNTQAQSTRYINAVAGNDINDGTSWGTAFKTISKALATAKSDNTINTILVADGIYYPAGDIINTNNAPDSAFTILRGGIKLYGGYNATTGIRDTANNHVYLDGNNKSNHILVIASLSISADSVIIDGFTIRNGNAGSTNSKNYNGSIVYSGYGGGIYMVNNANNTKTVIRNCLLNNNVATSSFVGGGGIYIENSSPYITNCTFLSNSALGNDGGGIQNMSSSPLITNCTFTGNYAFARGGGLANRLSSFLVIMPVLLVVVV